MSRRRTKPGGDGAPGAPPRGTSGGEDEALWAHVTESVEPLRRGKRRVPEVGIADTGAAAEGDRTAAPMPPARANDPPVWRKLGAARAASAVPVVGVPAAAAPAEPFDRRKARRIANGAIEIDGRIDLHGLREAEAHDRLVAFLRRAQAAGKRTILVITGKGRAGDDRDEPFDLSTSGRARGVLKRNVPRWLAGTELAGLVVSFTTAHSRHGGEGALYVHLRRVRS